MKYQTRATQRINDKKATTFYCPETYRPQKQRQNVQMENGTTDKPQWVHRKVLNSFKGSQPEVTFNPGLTV